MVAIAEGVETFEILDGVRRAKAAADLGLEAISAELIEAERVIERVSVPIKNLLSPKDLIDLSQQPAMGRWLEIMKATRAGEIVRPIRIQSGTRGTPLESIKFLFR